MPSVVSQFTTSLADRDVGFTSAPPDELSGVLEEVLVEPIVATSLPDFPELELSDLSVDIDQDPSPAALDDAETGLTGAPLAIADYGSVVVQGGSEGAEPISLYPDRHVPIVQATDVVPNMETAIEKLARLIADGNRNHIIATGPSATADMGDLVRGAHGPKEVHVVMMTDT